MRLEGALRLRADRGCGRLAVLEEHHRRDRGDPVALGDLRLLVDVHLDELELTGALLDDPVEDRGDRVARPAPFRPEVDEDGLVRLEHFVLEGRFGHRFCHSRVPFLIGFPISRTLALGVLFPADRRIEHHGPDVQVPACGARSRRSRARDPRVVGRRGRLRPAPRAEPRRRALELHRRADHGEQPDGRPPRLGPHAEGRLPALQGAARIRPALPERLRLPGPLGRGRGREVARPELEARHRGVRARRVRGAVQGACRRVRGGDHRPGPAARPLDGLGQRLLHVLGHEHRVHLAVPEDRPRARVALQGASLDAVVPPVRDLAFAARAGRRGELPGARASVALRQVPARGARGGVARRLDDDALDAAGERRGGGQTRCGVRAP